MALEIIEVSPQNRTELYRPNLILIDLINSLRQHGFSRSQLGGLDLADIPTDAPTLMAQMQVEQCWFDQHTFGLSDVIRLSIKRDDLTAIASDLRLYWHEEKNILEVRPNTGSVSFVDIAIWEAIFGQMPIDVIITDQTYDHDHLQAIYEHHL